MPGTEDPKLFTLKNQRGIEIEITNHGATVTALRVPDREGRIDDVVLGFDRLDRYLGTHPYFGGVVGRYANRIARGRFYLDGREYVVACNDGPNHLHGGTRGFDRARWEATAAGSTVTLRHTSIDGDEGYPGTLICEVTYTLTDADEFRIDYLATSDRPTVVNLTHHSYFNLAGRMSEDVLGHQLVIHADAFTPVDATLIPSGEIRPVVGTPFDLREPTTLGTALARTDPQLELGRGFDHNFILHPSANESAPRRAARLIEPRSGRIMEVWTTEPGLQVYTGGGLDGSIQGKNGRVYGRHAGLCLETQHFPDSPNQSGFPSTRLDPGQVLRSVTIHRFSTIP